MKARRTVAAALSVLALTAVAACGKDGSPSDTPTAAGGSAAPQLPTYTVKTDAKLDGSPVWTEAKKRGKLKIGAKADQPFLGFEDVQTGKRSGFDIEIAKMVAADLGFSADQIEWQTVTSTNRETSITGGQVDYYVGTYSITPARKDKGVAFGGPYYIAGQSLLVNKDNTDITGPETVKDKSVCTATGSTSIANIQKYGAKVTQFDNYSLCVEKLLTKEVDAVTTDDSILKGYAAKNQGKLKVVGSPFSEERYGVGLNKTDAALQKAINDALKAHEDNGDWKKAYDATLGLSGSAAPSIPALDPIAG
ncbi:glutamate ABC transporter substrate-binding protein [Kitasatospora sp. CB01950]|uniref:glutamate ABC transporter substrate-binding protein n=1 Tax=Kitasatospora sp. CB01950 TaxID=1703930 RepID=UPI00093EAF05|nr:glutamate ABC transporter substrate-binding protein [Kitasatospora sp. CB01950]OKJ00952.1 ABC transporter substrate-binding protein [Kitasatospora sp. CB01950]